MIKVLATGINCSIQDLGRYGFRRFGIPISGAMDQRALIFANQILANQLNTAGLEFVLQGPILKFDCATKIVISGAAFSPSVNDRVIPLNKIIEIKAGDLLKVGKCKTGMYGYLAISGGIDSPSKFDSKSYYKTINPEALLRKGEYLNNGTEFNKSMMPNTPLKKPDYNSVLITVNKGPDFELLDDNSRKNMLNQTIKISTDINRMGYILDSSASLHAKEILTAPVLPGTVQLTPSGKLIVLMRDAQTTGGYARCLQLTDQGISQLAQKRPYEEVQFVLKSNS